MSPEESTEREIAILEEKVAHFRSQIRKYETDKERYVTELCGKIDALVEILMELGMTECQARPLHNTILAKGIILDRIRKLKVRIPKPKHTDTRKSGDLQYQDLPGQIGMNWED